MRMTRFALIEALDTALDDLPGLVEEMSDEVPVVVIGNINGQNFGAMVEKVSAELDQDGLPVVYLELEA